MSEKVSYSRFLSARVRHRPSTPLSLSPIHTDMATLSSSSSSSAPSPVSPVLNPFHTVDATPVWVAAVFAGMKYDNMNFNDSQADFFRKHPKVPRSTSPHPLIPPQTMVRVFLDERFPTRVYFNSLLPDPPTPEAVPEEDEEEEEEEEHTMDLS